MNKKKLLALLMALVMTLSLVPVTAFAEQETPPTATVTSEENTDPVNIGTDFFGNTDPIAQATPVDVYTFTAVQDADTASASEYANWNCDYVITMNADVDAYSVGLFGAYGAWKNGLRIAFLSPVKALEGVGMPLLSSVASNPWTYSQVVSTVREFSCGAFNVSRENIGKKMTVELVIWKSGAYDNDKKVAAATNTDADNDYIIVESIEYEFTEANLVPLMSGEDFATPYLYVSSGYDPNSYAIVEGGTLAQQDEGDDGPHFAPEGATAYVAQIGEQGYATLQAAIDAASDGDTVTLVNDVVLSSVQSLDDVSKYGLVINKSLTLDGADHVIDSSALFRAIGIKGASADNLINVTIKDLTISSSKPGGSGIFTRGNLESLTLDNVDIILTSANRVSDSDYQQPLTISGDAQENIPTVTIKNDCFLQSSPNCTEGYAVINYVPASFNITNSTVKGWACLYAKPGSNGTSFSVDHSTLISSNLNAGQSNSFGVIVFEDNNVNATVTNTQIDVSGTNNIQAIAVFNKAYATNSGNNLSNTSVILGSGNTVTMLNDARFATNSANEGTVNGGTFTISGGIYDKAPNPVFIPEGFDVYVTNDNKYYVGEGAPSGSTQLSRDELSSIYYDGMVYYYWIVGSKRQGGIYDFYAPFEGPDAILMDGEFIELKGNITLSKDVDFVKECSFGDPIYKGGTFTLTFGDHSFDLNGHTFTLPVGVSCITDKQTNIFSAPSDYKVVETENGDGTFTYSVAQVTYVAQVGETKYETLQAAINDVPTNGTATTVTVLAGQTVLGGATIDDSRNVVLDLGGKTVYAFANLKEGKLTVQNGRLCGYAQSINVYGSADSTKAAGEYNELTIASSASIGNGGDYYGIILRDVQKDNAGESKYAYGPKINVDGEILDNIWVMGNIKEGNSVININNGAEVTANGTAIALQGKATVNVKGGAITGGTTGIENRGGTLNVTGGTITGNGEMIQVKPNGNGVTTLGAGVVVSQHTTRQDIMVNVTGGTITGKVALLAVNPEGNPTGEGTLTVNVTDGTFTGGVSAVAVLNADERVQVSLKGGTYSSDPSVVGNSFTYFLYGKDDTVTANVQGSGVATTVQTTDCVATGYMADSESGNVWIIKVKEDKFVDVKDTNEDAVSNQEDGSNTSFSFATATSETDDDDVTYAIKTTTIANEVQTVSYKPVETEVVTKSSVGTVVVDNGVTNNASTTAIENSIKETATSMTSTITAKKGSETATTDILKTQAAANAITKAAAAYEAGAGNNTSDIAKVEVQLETTLTGYTLANSGENDVTASKVVFSVVPKAVLLDVEGNQLGNAVELDNSDLTAQALKITFTLPIPDELVDTGTMKVKVTHRSDGYADDVKEYTVQGNAGSYFVEITAEHFSDFEVEKISATGVDLNTVNYVASYSLTCTDMIGVNFYFHLTDEVLNDENSRIQVSFDGQYESGDTIPVSSVTADKDGEYKFSYYVAPAESTKNITLTLHTDSGTVPIYDRNGNKTDDGTFAKSMKDVAEIYLSSTTASAKMKTLASRLIAYCVYTELYFKGTTDHSYSNVVLGNIAAAKTGLANYALVNSAGGSIGYTGMSLLLDKETSIKLYTYNPQTLAYSFNGGASTELTPYASGGEYAVKISNLPGAYLDRMYSITGTSGEVLRVSALSWANSMINKEEQYKQNIAAAMYYYNVAANEYFGEKGV